MLTASPFLCAARFSFDLALSDMERWTSYVLPSGQFGHLVLTTSYGILDHHEAIRKHTGGKILGYFY